MELLKQLKITANNQGASIGKNQWFSAAAEKMITSINPTTEEVIAKISGADERNYQQIIEAASTEFKRWREVPAPKRGDIVRQIGMALRENKDLLGSLISLEMGKSKQEGDGEVQEMIDMADFAVGQSRMLYGATMHSERVRHRMYEQWQPYGVVGVITAFNFPVAVWAWNAFLAAIAGNTVIWKPSSKVALCAIAVQHICNEVMAQNGLQGIFSLFIALDNHVAGEMIDDKRVPLISFTGSTSAGRRIGERVSARLGRCILELGGNNAVIVDETADFKLAVPAVVFGALGTAGQRCTTT